MTFYILIWVSKVIKGIFSAFFFELPTLKDEMYPQGVQFWNFIFNVKDQND